ncbi:Mediator of RNA polymerase II transcription subunit 6 [Coniochaeta hoffmannii]|uniref:Mediator of RNA polymerase II transcription subunit 6 n=1 Tax=Coniochaeta hoffmannii TaxID=91930 RepID=A0AA38RGI5_9PEZI|nr:Mediator of RNA polymerase II transcription subunit 6 [Coniochaeta hoffmannii]
MALQTPLDETMWQCDLAAVGIHQLHSNTILPYFQMSPFYDQSSNNAILWGQAMSNANMYPLVQTREAFEGRLKTMSGVEFVVAQEPSEMAPGTGTGVWVINKQHRRKRHGMEDEVNVLATYFVVGEHIYMAPSMADVLSSRLAAVSDAVGKAITAADNVQRWSPALGRVYQNAPPPPPPSNRPKGAESKEATPIPGATVAAPPKEVNRTALDSRLAEESLAIYLKYGDEFMDENPITGQPGSFHLSSTGRKDKLSVPLGAKAAPLSLKDTPLPPLNTKVAAENPLARPGKETKSPRSGAPKLKRRKSKGGTNTPTTSTPNTSTPS